MDQKFAGYKQLIDRAHDRGIKVIGSPIGPYKGAAYWSEDGEAARKKVNDWILHGGAFDGITESTRPSRIRPIRKRCVSGYHDGRSSAW